LFLQAAKNFGIDLTQSFMIGDKVSDLEAAANARCKEAVLVLTGHGMEEKDDPRLGGNTCIEPDVLAAVKTLLQRISEKN
jgi:D-glycero-D-manno-heptose 1,7-bisphosphate phosphatase